VPEQWAIEVADQMKAKREEFQRGLDALRAAGHGEENVFVSATRDIIGNLNEALRRAAEDYGIEP